MPIANARNFPIDKLCTAYYITLLIAVAHEHPLVGTSEIYAVLSNTGFLSPVKERIIGPCRVCNIVLAIESLALS